MREREVPGGVVRLGGGDKGIDIEEEDAGLPLAFHTILRSSMLVVASCGHLDTNESLSN